MTEGSITKNILFFALPLMLSSVLQLLYNAADVIVVGKFAEDGLTSLAAVSSTNSLITLITNVAIGLSVGVNVLIARHIGAKNTERADRALHTAATVAIASGIFTCIVGFLICGKALEWMGTPDDVIEKSTLYLRIYFLGSPALIIYNFGSASLRSAGDTTRPLIFLTISGLVNVVCNLLFVIVFNMDVAGVATATIMSQYISATLVVLALKKGQGFLLLNFKKICFDKREFKDIVILGIPAAIQSSCFSISNVAIQSGVNSFKNAAVNAGSGAAGSIEGFVYVVMNAFYHAALTFTSQNIGARKPRRIPKIIFSSCFLSTMFWLICVAIIFTIPETLLGFYTDDPDAIKIGVERFNYVALPYILCGIMEISTGVLRGSGHSISAMIISIVGVCGIRIVWIYTVFQVYHSFGMLYLCYTVSWAPVIVANFIAFYFIYKKNLKPLELPDEQAVSVK